MITERILQLVHKEYEFDEVVSEKQREWWFLNALQVFVTHCNCYEEIEDVGFDSQTKKTVLA